MTQMQENKKKSETPGAIKSYPCPWIHAVFFFEDELTTGPEHKKC
jgi:hypothetical protein